MSDSKNEQALAGSKLGVTNRLGELLKERGLSANQVAERSGIPYRSLLKAKRADANPPLGYALLLAAEVGAQVGAIYSVTRGSDVAPESVGGGRGERDETTDAG